MDYRDILRGELARSDVDDGGYDPAPQHDMPGTTPFTTDYLLRHVPTEGDVLAAMAHLAGLDPADQSPPLLIPIRPYLQAKLRVTSQRLEELISDNEWIHSWIDYIRAAQEVRIVEEFSAGNMEDSTLKWLLWTVLGDAVDLSSPRTGASLDASPAQLDLYNSTAGDHRAADY
jgi:hypothetical protein